MHEPELAHRKLPLQLVKQEHALGCAVACVASLCGLTYKDALTLFHSPENAWTRGYYCSEIVAALGRAGIDYVFSTFNSSEHHFLLERTGTIVFLDHSQLFPHGHFLVRGEKSWMNPWSNFPQMIPVKAAFQEKLAGNISYILFPKSN